MDEKEKDALKGEIQSLLKPIDNHLFNISILTVEDFIFSSNIIKNGELIYTRNLDKVLNFLELISNIYRDLSPRYKKALEEVIKTLYEES